MEEIIHPKGKVFYSMGEVCEIFGVNASLLRFWEDEFPTLRIAKNGRGHRIYTPEDVDNIRVIYHLVKEQGMTLEGAKKRLRQNREGLRRDAEIMDRLRNIRTMLVALREELGDNTEVIEIDDDYDESPLSAESENVADVVSVAEPESVNAPETEAEPQTEQEDIAESEEVAQEDVAVQEEILHPSPVEVDAEPAADVPAQTPQSSVEADDRKPRIIEQTLF